MTPSEAAIALVDVMKRLEGYEAKLKQAKEDVATFKEFLKVSKELRGEYKAILFPARVRKPKEKPEVKKRGRKPGSKNKVKDKPQVTLHDSPVPYGETDTDDDSISQPATSGDLQDVPYTPDGEGCAGEVDIPKSNLSGWERGVPKPKFGVNE